MTQDAPVSLLLVDDEATLREPLAEYLTGQGFAVREAESAAAARSILQDVRPDLVLLDIMMPGEDGLSLTRHLVESQDLPVILLTAKTEATDRIVGLEMGADDYVIKPFEPRELVARIRSVLRRANKAGPLDSNAQTEDGALYEFEDWSLDPLKRKLTDPEGVGVPISTAEFRLLRAFLDHPREVLDRDRLLDMVQGRTAHIFDRAVDNQVSRLRRKIEADTGDPQLILTVRGGRLSLCRTGQTPIQTAGIGVVSRVRIPFANSLLGQVMLVVAFGLLVGQAISAVLLYQAAEQRREAALVNAIAFRLVTDNERQERIERRGRRAQRDAIYGGRTDNGAAGRNQQIRRFGIERSEAFPSLNGDQLNRSLEQSIAEVLDEQLLSYRRIKVVERRFGVDPFIVSFMKKHPRFRRSGWQDRAIWVAGVELPGEAGWRIVRLPQQSRPKAIAGSVMLQTALIFVILFALLYVVLRRITRPLAQLTRRVDGFARNPDRAMPLDESGPQDIRQLIAAHNTMESRVAAMLDEKDVMLGAIGHDLKTPLAALRVRIESVQDDIQRNRMAEGIEDITRTLDDILSLARVGRTAAEPERVNLTALAESIVDEFDDLGEPVELAAVELGETRRIVASVHVTWIKRALRNLISNAVRYGENATVTLTEKGVDAVITIDDNGPGVPEDRIAEMLEPFARGESSRNRATGGAGLGLTLARAIADQHGGTLALSNRPEGGLRAELRLPLAGFHPSE